MTKRPLQMASHESFHLSIFITCMLKAILFFHEEKPAAWLFWHVTVITLLVAGDKIKQRRNLRCRSMNCLWHAKNCWFDTFHQNIMWGVAYQQSKPMRKDAAYVTSRDRSYLTTDCRGKTPHVEESNQWPLHNRQPDCRCVYLSSQSCR